MAKNEKNERKALKKGKASFTLIGKAKITDKTFNLDNTFDSGWTSNQMYLGIDCGNGNTVFCEMSGGFFPNDDNILRGFSKEDKDDSGKSKMVEVAWEDRFNDDLLDTIADTAFITVGIEKDIKGKTVYKKFLSGYDAVAYIEENLTDGTIVNVKGNIGYSEYDGNVSTRKEVTSIVLSKVEDEADFKATFAQTILIDKDSVGKVDKEKGTVELNAYVVDYVGKVKIDGKKTDIKKNISYPKNFEIFVDPEKKEVSAKMIDKFFKVKKKSQINEITVIGNIVEGTTVVNITEDDIPDDIKELIEMGLYSEEEAKAKLAVGGGSRERRMIITKPDIVYVGKDENRVPTVAYEEGKYDESDLLFYEVALSEAGVVVESNDDEDDSSSDASDDDLMALLEDM